MKQRTHGPSKVVRLPTPARPVALSPTEAEVIDGAVWFCHGALWQSGDSLAYPAAGGQPGHGPAVWPRLRRDRPRRTHLRRHALSLAAGRSVGLLSGDRETMRNRIVAEAVLVRRRGSARSHIGEIRIVVAPEFRNRGLGTQLIRELCEIADDAGLDKVLLEVVADREAEALKAAEWLGFIRVGTMDGGARDQDGHLHDIVMLAMPLGKWYQWTKY